MSKKTYSTGILRLSSDIDRNRLIPKGVIENIQKIYSSYTEVRDCSQDKDIELCDEEVVKEAPQLKSCINPWKQTNNPDKSQVSMMRPDNIENVVGVAAANIAQDANANCIVSFEKSDSNTDDDSILGVKVVIFKRVTINSYKKSEYRTKMRKMISGSVIPLKELLMEAIKKKYICKGERIVCVGDESVGMGYKGLLFIFDVDKIFFNMSVHHLTENIGPDVLEAAINIATEIGSEGREGRKIGTAFIIGDHSEIARYTRQLIINPFSTCSDETKMITDPNLRETIKGFSQLDGVFIVDKSGVIVSAGTHINIDMASVDLNCIEGFGTRHRYCAAITKLTNAIAVVVSQSGGIVRIFKEGRIIMKLP
ncbi:hypothetical protein COT48_02775 [Candidatus Woesearchaeota archaeon CG08_land_8_20_14_0_20_47_9]|nr:MAG: hypothetical protein AUJ69_01595 [Candidatus Woesearchaeota archaeon CG1_02_47_18]PIN74688.1 MAG: hypothetical protein COV22_01035 [Candidatus Woesearchaeota archaeon CG10_big_fil_rev_8_21_14_0_10_47_5]PIO03975.1 MAG: hypothetical protein COT48_02775 [Candidatus Woesearchaeota archaeon CG08_land_8_20_14_0_20_47_9]